MVDDYQTTNHVPEALHRLTEIYLILGLRDQARKTASVLGYNYPGSEWYEDSYNNLFDSGLVQQAGPPRKPDERGFFSAPGTRFAALIRYIPRWVSLRSAHPTGDVMG